VFNVAIIGQTWNVRDQRRVGGDDRFEARLEPGESCPRAAEQGVRTSLRTRRFWHASVILVGRARWPDMNESPDDLERLQALLNHSTERAGPHLRRTFELPEHALSAAQLVQYWGQEQQFAMATVTTRGEPRVAPVQVLLHQARLYVPTAADATRVRHIAQRPSVSLTHWVSGAVAIIAHGSAILVANDGGEFGMLASLYRGQWWQDLHGSGEGAFLRIELAALYTWARDLAALLPSPGEKGLEPGPSPAPIAPLSK